MAKIYLEVLLIDSTEKINNLQSDVLQYYWIISSMFFALNYKRLFQARSYIFIMIFLFISMGPFAHYRYLMPLIFVWVYVVLPGRRDVLTDNEYSIRLDNAEA